MPSFNSYNCAILEQTLVYLVELDLMNYFQKSTIATMTIPSTIKPPTAPPRAAARSLDI